jgi:ankyrin repeat protein
MLQELSMGLVKAIVPSVINPLDAWRLCKFFLFLLSLLLSSLTPNHPHVLVISSLRFDEGNMKMMQHLLRMGILDVIASESEPNEDLAIAAMAQAFSKPPEASTPSSKRVLRQSIVPMLGSRAMSTISLDTYQLTRLNDVFFLDLNAVAWIISLKNTKALQHFIKKGYDVTLPVDTLGNTCLHYIAAHGIAEMVDVILAEKKVRFEALNPHGQTAGMIAAKVGNFKVAKRLFEMKISARKSLEGKYSAWVLAFARRYEKKEKNLQTGRYGDDDETHFSVDPDPFYSTWYSS